MRNEQELQPDTQNSSALGNISVLSPSQRREQERLRQEKEAKAAAEREKKMLAAAKRREEIQRQKRKQGLGGIVLSSLGILFFCGGGIVGFIDGENYLIASLCVLFGLGFVPLLIMYAKGEM